MIFKIYAAKIKIKLLILIIIIFILLLLHPEKGNAIIKGRIKNQKALR
jgi:hypothetical protein